MWDSNYHFLGHLYVLLIEYIEGERVAEEIAVCSHGKLSSILGWAILMMWLLKGLHAYCQLSFTHGPVSPMDSLLAKARVGWHCVLSGCPWCVVTDEQTVVHISIGQVTQMLWAVYENLPQFSFYCEATGFRQVISAALALLNLQPTIVFAPLFLSCLLALHSPSYLECLLS